MESGRNNHSGMKSSGPEFIETPDFSFVKLGMCEVKGMVPEWDTPVLLSRCPPQFGKARVQTFQFAGFAVIQ